MFKFTVEEELSCKVEGSGKFYAKKGAMIAFKGNFKFDKMLLGPDNGGGIMGSLLGMATTHLCLKHLALLIRMLWWLGQAVPTAVEIPTWQ